MKALRAFGLAALFALAAFVIEIIFSAVCTLIYFQGIAPQTYEACTALANFTFGIFMTALAGGIILLNIIYAKKGYALASLWIGLAYLVVFAIFAAVTLLVTLDGNSIEPAYTYLCLGYKIYAFGAFSRFFSALVVNTAGVIVCTLTAVLSGVVSFITRKYKKTDIRVTD